MRIFDKFKIIFKKKRDTSNESNEEQNQITTDKSKICTGHNNYAIGIDAIKIPIGKCMHINRRTINKERLDGLPISERDWTHCIFYSEFGECFFAGNCPYCKYYTEDELNEIREKYKADKNNKRGLYK